MKRLFPAMLLATAMAGCGGAVKTQAASTLAVSIKATPDVGTSPMQVDFTALVDEAWSGDPATLQYSWNFGDGSAVESGVNVSHVYVADGSYDAKLTVTDTHDTTVAATKRIDVGVTGPGVDIIINSVEATPNILNPGSPLTVKFNVENTGTEPTASDVIVRLFILPVTDWPATPGSPTGVVNVGVLQGGEAMDGVGTAYVPAQFTAGDYYVFAFADGPDDIHETHEDNNVGRAALPLQVSLGTLPVDIVVDAVTATPASAAAGATITVSTTLRNAGSAASPAFKLAHRLSVDPTVDFTSDIALGALTSVASIAPGATVQVPVTLTLPMTLDDRPYYLGVIADVNGDVAETDETNNARAYAGTIAVTGGTGCVEDALEPNETLDTASPMGAGSYPSLKLCPSSTDWFSMTLAPGERLTATANFANGNGDLNLALFKDGTTSAMAVSNGTGNDETVDSGLVTAAGTWRVRVTATGNAAGMPYALTLAKASSGGNGKDLVPANFTVSPSSVTAGSPVNIAFDVYDFGDVAVTESSVAELWLSTDAVLSASDTMLASIPVGPIAAGAHLSFAQQVTIPASIPIGGWQVFVKLDAADAVVETYEDNNTAVRALAVGLGCGDDSLENNDDQASAVALGSGTVTGLRECLGDEDWFKVEVPAGGTLDVKVLFTHAEGDIDAYIRNAAGTVLKSGTGTSDNEILSYTAATAGTCYVRVKLYADNGTVLGNGYSLVIDGAVSNTIDLSPSAITFTPSTALPGVEVQTDFTVRNLSTQDSPAFDVSVRLSMDATIDGSDMEVATVPSAAIPANGSVNFTKKFIVPAAAAGSAWRVGVFADPTNQIVEASETNNGRASTASLTVPMPCTDDSWEENDNAGQAKPLAIGSTFSALKVCGGDEDWYSFTPSASGSLTVRIDFVNASGDLDLAIFDATGATLLANSSSAASDVEQVTIPVTAATTYAVRVRGFNGSTNTYSIRGTP